MNRALRRRPAPLTLRPAQLHDLDALVAIEARCFTSDRLSRRSLRRLLTRGHCIALVAEQDRVVCGYAVVLLHGATALARLYSLAVDPAQQGQGIGAQLLREAEEQARDAGCAVLRLEVRPDSVPALRRYRSAGYRDIGVVTDYYEDHSDALRMEKQLAGGDTPNLARVPYYGQTLDFTCGPASLLMAMHALDSQLEPDRTLELRLWREATLIYTTSGHGGCGPRGIALAAARRGFHTEIFVSSDQVPFIDSVRNEDKREVMRLVHEEFERSRQQAGIPLHVRCLSAAELGAAIDAGAVPIVLISIYRITGDKSPHWVVVTGVDEHFVYIHDPFVDYEKGKSATDSMNVPIARAEFDRISRYGGKRLRATVMISRQT